MWNLNELFGQPNILNIFKYIGTKTGKRHHGDHRYMGVTKQRTPKNHDFRVSTFSPTAFDILWTSIPSLQNNRDQREKENLVAQTVKRLHAMQETRVRSLGCEDPWRKKWQSTPIFLHGKFRGLRSHVGYSPRSRKESDTTEQLCFALLHPTSVQFSSVAQSCPALCDAMNCSTPGLPVHHHLPEFTQTQVHRVSDAIQPSHPLSSPSPPVLNPSQHQSLFQ